MSRKKKIEIDYIVFMVGQKCSLRCKHCMHMIPYGEQRSYDAKEIIKDLKAIAKVTDIKYLQIQGGEPFTHPDIAYIISEVAKIPIGCIEMPTNATLVLKPDVIKALQENPNVIVRISNYPCAKEQRERFIKQLEENNIRYVGYDFMFNDNSWYFTGAMGEKRIDDDKKLDEVYKWCTANCKADIKVTLCDGIFMRCAKIPIIREVYGSKEKYGYEEVNVRSIRKMFLPPPLYMLRKGIKKYIKHRNEPRHACRYCAIYPEHVEGGIQLTKEEYEKILKER